MPRNTRNNKAVGGEGQKMVRVNVRLLENAARKFQAKIGRNLTPAVEVVHEALTQYLKGE